MRNLLFGFCVSLMLVAGACSGTQVVDETAPVDGLETARYEVFGMD